MWCVFAALSVLSAAFPNFQGTIRDSWAGVTGWGGGVHFFFLFWHMEKPYMQIQGVGGGGVFEGLLP